MSDEYYYLGGVRRKRKFPLQKAKKKPVIKKHEQCRFCGSYYHSKSLCPVKPPTKPCKHCGSMDHRATWCPSKPRRQPIKPESDETKAARLATRKEWLRLNPPNEDGEWECYLQISKYCPVMVNKHTLSLEHVKPKQKHKGLRYEVSNIRAACRHCNKLKGGWEIEQLATRSWNPIEPARVEAVKKRLGL